MKPISDTVVIDVYGVDVSDGKRKEKTRTRKKKKNFRHRIETTPVSYGLPDQESETSPNTVCTTETTSVFVTEPDEP